LPARAVAVKAALVCPAATVTLDGTVTLVLLLVSTTLTPPESAGPVRLTVQGELLGALTVGGEQFKLLS